MWDMIVTPSTGTLPASASRCLPAECPLEIEMNCCPSLVLWIPNNYSCCRQSLIHWSIARSGRALLGKWRSTNCPEVLHQCKAERVGQAFYRTRTALRGIYKYLNLKTYLRIPKRVGIKDQLLLSHRLQILPTYNSSTARELWTSLLILPNSVALLRAEEALATVFIKVSLGDIQWLFTNWCHPTLSERIAQPETEHCHNLSSQVPLLVLQDFFLIFPFANPPDFINSILVLCFCVESYGVHKTNKKNSNSPIYLTIKGQSAPFTFFFFDSCEYIHFLLAGIHETLKPWNLF